jgi:hypothetical protein
LVVLRLRSNRANGKVEMLPKLAKLAESQVHTAWTRSGYKRPGAVMAS